LPKISVPKGQPWTVAQIAATGLNSVWVNVGVGKFSTGASIVLHWNWKAWTRLAFPAGLAPSAGYITGDGHGGIWMSGDYGTSQATFYHYSGGRWARRPGPALAGGEVDTYEMHLITGTWSVLAAVDLIDAKTNSQAAAIVKYGH
jgi:hypothetical protein